MKKQTLTALALAACTLGAFAGCGGDSPSATKSRYETGVSLTVNLDTSELTSQDVKVGYRLYHISDPFGTEYNKSGLYNVSELGHGISVNNLCFTDLKNSTHGYELKDMIVYFDVQNNSNSPISLAMEVTSGLSDYYEFDCEQIAYIQEKDEDLETQTQVAAFRIMHKNDIDITRQISSVALKLSLKTEEQVQDTDSSVFTYTFDADSKTCEVATYTDADATITTVKVPRKVVNPEDNQTYTVTKLADALFLSNGTIEKVYLPDTIKKIGRSTFAATSKLTQIYFPDGVECISRTAFSRSALTGDVYLPESLREFDNIPDAYKENEDAEQFAGGAVFQQATNITKLVINEGTNRLPMSFCGGCTNLKTVIFPTTLEVLAAGLNSSNLKQATTFMQCGLEYLDMYNTNVKILGAGFAGKSPKIKSVYLPKNLETIENQAFYQDAGLGAKLEYVYMPNTVKIIEKGAFYHCENLKTVEMSTGIENIGMFAFESCFELKNITLPEGLKYLQKCAFEMCYNLPINIPSTVEYIGDFAFNHCKFATNEVIKLPAGIKQIGGQSYDPENPNPNVIGSHVFYNAASRDVKAFEIDESNENYMVQDGVLYRKENGVPTVLIAYPAGKTETKYVMPNTVRDSYELAMSRPYYLDEIVLGDSFVIREIADTANAYYLNEDWANNLSAMIYVFTGITKVTCNETNPNYKSINGAVYSKDGKTLYFASVLYNEGESGVLTIADGVTTIFAGAIANDANRLNNNADDRNPEGYIKNRCNKIIIPASVTSIADITLTNINAQDWTIEVDSGNTSYKVNESGKLEAIPQVEVE